MDELKMPNLDFSKIPEYKLHALKQIKQNPRFKEIIAELKLTDDEIMNSASKFIKVEEDNQKCDKCAGKCNKIPSKIKLQLNFDIDKRLFDIDFVTCPLYKEEVRRKRKFLYQDFPSTNFDYEFNSELLKNSYTNIRKNVLMKLINILQNNSSRGLYVYGDKKIGKTFMLSLFAIKYVEKYDCQVAFCSSIELFKELNDLNFSDKNELKNRLQLLSEIDLLILDGFGDEYKSDFIRDNYVYPLLSNRCNNNKLTMITSNFTVDEITSMYSLSKSSYPKAKQLKSVLQSLTDTALLEGFPYSI